MSEIRFLREALITARLEHPGIVPVHEAGRWPDGTPFYAMKLVAGRSLRDLIAERPTVDERIGLLHHVIAVADAIAYAHGRSIIHRDLKPSNVIVGDFGETVVIDWGLAKDLSAADEPVIGGGPFRTTPDDGLTSTGAILGTPAYMAPEQARGEPVDQRADVFAIGAMLWELCSLEKLPPAYSGQRRRLLRRSGIDEDLATIIENAIEADPARRYADATALAADLKAFKTGARISARRYSLVALIAHWTRRHRALALSLMGAIMLAAAASLLYVHNITAERDRADAALAHSEAAKDALLLQHAELLLQSDPTSALASVTDYRGPRTARAHQIAAEAKGRGVGYPISDAHNDAIRFLAGTSDGAVVSISGDRKIVSTKADVSTVLASDVALPLIAQYSSARRVLAYSSTTGTALLEPETKRRATLTQTSPLYVAFSEDGNQLAVLGKNHEITVWSTDWPARLVWRSHRDDAESLLFAGKERLVVGARTGFSVLSFKNDPVISLALVAEAYSTSADRLVTGDEQGMIALFSIPELKPLGKIATCREGIRDVELVSQKSVIAFACQDNSAGVVDYLPGLSIRERFTTPGPVSRISASGDGRLLVALSDSTIAYVHDIDSRLTRHYEGPARLTSVSAPTSSYQRIITGDINGLIRTWMAPDTAAYATMHTHQSTLRADISPDSNVVATGSADGTVSVSRLKEHTYAVKQGHTSLVDIAYFMPDGHLFTSGLDGTVLIWQTEDLSVIQSLKHLPSISDVGFSHHGKDVLLASGDGRLLNWSLDSNTPDILFTSSRSLTDLEVLATDGTVVVGDAAGAVWHVQDKNRSISLRRATGDTVRLLRASSDGRFLAIGTSSGDVTIFETRTWTALHFIKMDGSLRSIAFSLDGKLLALASDRHHLRLLSLSPSLREVWQEKSLDVRQVSFSPDGRALALVCGDGSTWFYSLKHDTWSYAKDHYAFTASGHFSQDSRIFVSSDNDGVVVVRNVDASLDDGQ